MRAFSTLFALAAVALSVNAASLNSRSVTPAVQKCINDITAAGGQLSVVKTAVDGFTKADSYSGAIAIHNKEQTLEGLIKTANTDCCATTTVVSTEDAQAVLAVVQNVVPQITGALQSIVSKKSEFDAVPLATPIVKYDIKSLNGLTSKLDGCLVAVTPAEFKDAANNYVNQINTAFSSAYTAYGI